MLFARQSLVASGAGKCSIVLSVPEATTFEGHIIRVRLDQEKASPLFYYYFFKSPIGKETVQSIVMQVAAAGIRASDLARLEVPCPPLPTQRRIADILGALDDKIECNRRINQTLEAMAQALYKHWFVDSELGEIPQGWEVKPIGEVLETLGGGTPSTTKPEYWENGNINWFVPSDLTGAKTLFISESSKKINRKGLAESAAHLFPAHSVMMTSRATIGEISINRTEACTNQGFITLVPNDKVSLYQIVFWQCRKTHLGTSSAGNVFQRRTKSLS